MKLPDRSNDLANSAEHNGGSLLWMTSWEKPIGLTFVGVITKVTQSALL